LEKQITQWISEAEARWLDRLQSNATEAFSGTFLPSHDQEHHLRVWLLCKKILVEISGFNTLTPDLVEGVMIAAWFHDLGMVQSMDESHGILGRKMFERFFRENKLPRPPRFMEIGEAIEKHDTKDASLYNAFVPGLFPGVLNILSIADDLDALGHVGIYRYVEIYLHRNVPIRELGTSILRNANLRYRNICRSLANCPILLESTGKIFFTLEDFFNLFNQQMLAAKKPDKIFYGYVGLVNHIRKSSIDGEVRPQKFLEECEGQGYGKIVHTYFKNLKNELEKAEAL